MINRIEFIFVSYFLVIEIDVSKLKIILKPYTNYFIMPIEKKKILVIDDKETIAKIIIIYMQQDYDITWFDNGEKGYEWIQNGNTPDLIISDIKMPVMRGDEFLRKMKNHDLFKYIPIVMLSSEDSTSERFKLLSEVAEDYIVKPFNPLELKIRINKIL